MTRERPPCGTVRGARSHRWHKELICDDCRRAEREHQRARRAKVARPVEPDTAVDRRTDVFDELSDTMTFKALEWRQRGACRGHPVEVFYPTNRGPGTGRVAKAICARCPVLDECAEASRDEPAGIWAGLTPKERRTRR